MKARLLVKLLSLIVPIIIASRFPFLQNLTVTSYTFAGDCLVVTGTVEVVLTEEAWTKFGYRDGNFYWFNEWWQQQGGMAYGPVRLVSIEWTLLEHTESYDRLGFEAVLTLRRGP
jgi:hypothetical protein